MINDRSYIAIFQKILFPQVLEKYWEILWEHRERQGSWHENSIFFDFFKPWAEQFDRSNQGKGGLVCVVPAPRVFWDSLIALYCLKVKEFGTHAAACMALMKNLDKVLKGKEIMEGEFFRNFEPFHMTYLYESANHAHSNMFFDDPFQSVCQMKAFLFLQGKEKFPSDQKKKSIGQIYEETERQFKEMEWPLPVLGLEQFSKEMCLTFKISEEDDRIDHEGVGRDSPEDNGGSDPGDHDIGGAGQRDQLFQQLQRPDGLLLDDGGEGLRPSDSDPSSGP